MNNDKLILLIDDNKDVRDSLIWTLEYEGYSILSASHGQEAFDLINKNFIPSVILLDMMMPVMNGWEFREKQQRNPDLCHIPTIILTAKVNLTKTIQLHPNESIISKPFDLVELLKILKKIFD